MLRFGLWLFSCVLFSAIPVAAQILPEGKGWADLERPEYDPLGIPIGGFELFPSITGLAQYNSNPIALSAAGEDDFILSIRPEIALQSNWSRHQLSLSGFVESAFYTSLTAEDHTDAGAIFSGQLDISSQTALRTFVRYEYRHEDRAEVNTVRMARSPIARGRINANLSLDHSFNKLRLGLEAGFQRLNFRDGEGPAGSILDQDFRDRDEVFLDATARYAFSPGYSVFVAARYSDIDYNLEISSPAFQPGIDIDRDATDIRIDAGIAAEITDVIYGTFGIGYLRADFDSAALARVSGLSLRGDVVWNFSPISTFLANFERATQPSADTISPLRVDTSVELGLDHELLYNLIFSARASYARLNFENITRKDDEYGAGLSARYLMNNLISATIGYRFDKRAAGTPIFGYQAHEVLFTLTTAL